jgi:hypothetical protein
MILSWRHHLVKLNIKHNAWELQVLSKYLLSEWLHF